MTCPVPNYNFLAQFSDTSIKGNISKKLNTWYLNYSAIDPSINQNIIIGTMKFSNTVETFEITRYPLLINLNLQNPNGNPLVFYNNINIPISCGGNNEESSEGDILPVKRECKDCKGKFFTILILILIAILLVYFGIKIGKKAHRGSK